MSRLPGKRAWPVLRGPRRSNAPGLPDETWLGIITRQAIRRGTFSSVNALIARIRDYIEHWNTGAEPFTWTATAEEILAKVRWVEANLKKLVDEQLEVTGTESRGTRPARARPATGAERTRLWRLMTEIWPDYDRHQRRATRQIPVVILEKVTT